MAEPDILSHAWDAVLAFAVSVVTIAGQMLLSPWSSYSLAALGVTLGLAALFTLRSRRNQRSVPPRVLVRALLPSRIWRSASGRTDIAFALFNIFLGMLLFGWAILGQATIATATQHALSGVLGTSGLPALPAPVMTVAIWAVLFLAYEFAYWLDHYLSHKLPLLWQFHQVHHTAHSLSLVTNFRVHPVDTIVFYNLVAVFTGLAGGVMSFVFAIPASLNVGANVLMLASAVLLTHLHHSHLWITFGTRGNRILLSPAHHQIHHSAAPEHHDRNFGNALAIFDCMFGTLHAPAARREALTFGVDGLGYDPQSFTRSFWMPYLDAAQMAAASATRKLRRRRASADPACSLIRSA